MNDEYLREIDGEGEKIDGIIRNFPEIICVHVYKSVPHTDDEGSTIGRRPCIEGMQLADTLAELILQGILNSDEKFVPPVIILGADARDSFGGIPLSETYKLMINMALRVRGLNPDTCCKFFDLERFGYKPVDTRSEIIAHKAACEYLQSQGLEGKPVSFLRKFHSGRVKYLLKRLDFQHEILTHETVALKYFLPDKEDPYRLIKMDKMFPKTSQSEAAEELNMMIMAIDRGGLLLSAISRIKWIKHFLLTSAAGHP